MVKIGVLGSGTAAMVAIMMGCGKTHNDDLPIKITCIHDPSIPTLSVGESISPVLHTRMMNIIDFEYVRDHVHIDATLRFGTLHDWEDNAGNDFAVKYPQTALHINSQKFSGYVLSKIKEKYSHFFEEVHDRVQAIGQSPDKVFVRCENKTYAFDYVIDSRGFPTQEELNSGDYGFPMFETVNSVIAYQHHKPYQEVYSSATFHKNGWMFGVPLTHKKTFGYLYNDRFTSKEEAIEHFKKLVPAIESDKVSHRKWTHYYRKHAIENRILYLGNKLYFLEPIQALPLFVYDMLANMFFSCLQVGMQHRELVHEVNTGVDLWMSHMESIIAMNYAGDNKMDSEFWNVTKQIAIRRLYTSDVYMKWARKVYEDNKYGRYWYHPPELMETYTKGYNININALFEP